VILARAIATAAALTIAMGCTTVTRLGSHDAARTFDGGMEIPCGPTTCTGGAVCCNESCGICVLPGATCLDIPCTDAGLPCGGDEALLESGDCTTLYGWNGSTCLPRTGCTCSGRDCGRLRATAADCFEEHAVCWDDACTSDGATPCPTGYFCELAACADTTGTCARQPTSCEGSIEPVVCGCDGAPYASVCTARQTAVSHDGSDDCGLCDPRVPILSAGCSTVLGYAWDGGQCAPARGCACTGACDRLYASLADCTTARAPCITFACGTLRCLRWDELCVTEASGTRCDPLPGTCEGVPSCSCVGDGLACEETGPGAYVVTPL
jgi:hypothetical protein